MPFMEALKQLFFSTGAFTITIQCIKSGSADPTINSQGNRYPAPVNPNSKEVNFTFIVFYHELSRIFVAIFFSKLIRFTLLMSVV